MISRGYPNSLVDEILSEVHFADRKKISNTKTESAQENSTICDTISTITAMFENILMDKWYLVFNTKPATTQRDT